jgi:5-methylthioribose kinase
VPSQSEFRFLLSPANAVDYLRERGFFCSDERGDARELTGGVSNEVILVSRPHGDNVVLKQVRERLNVADEWHCSVERVWREIEVLRECERLLGGQATDAMFTVEVPGFLFDDRANYLYAMSAAPPEHVVWRNELLSGVARMEIAAACGTGLGTLHGGSWHDAALASQFDNRKFFDDLRLDPYYRQVARVHPELSNEMSRLIDSVWNERHCLVHGDFSPKNLLVYDNRVMLIDFEVGHYGDPAFDLGFLVSHLMLKAFYHAPKEGPFFDLIDSFWRGYLAALSGVVSRNDLDALIERGILNFAGCALARLDGKSKIDYLRDGARRDAMRQLCRTIFTSRLKQWAEVRSLAGRLLADCLHSRCAPMRQGE